MHFKNYPSTNCVSGSLPVVCNLRLKLRNLKKIKATFKVQYDIFLNDLNCKELYTDRIKEGNIISCMRLELQIETHRENY